MARTDKPRKDSNAAKKSKLKETTPRQARGGRGTFAAKTPVLPVKASVKRKAGKVKAKQPQEIALEDPFPASESIDLPFLDIDEFSDYCAEQNQAAINFVNETDFDAFVSKHCASPLQSLPERPVEISSPTQQQPPTQSLPAPCAPQPSAKSAHPISLTPPQLSVLHNFTPLTPHRIGKSANCTARSHRLPAIDMFRLHAPSSPPPTFPSVPSSAPGPLTLSEAPHHPALIKQRAEVHTGSPSPSHVCVTSFAALTPAEHILHPAPCTAATSRSKLLTALSVRPLPQPLLPLTPALLPVPRVAPHHTPPKCVGDHLDPPYIKGSRVLVTTGMHCGRYGVVRGVQRVGKKGPFLSGQWSVLLDGKDLVALPDAFLAKC